MDHFASEGKQHAKQVAYTAVEKLKPSTTSVVEYRSKGHVLIIADAQQLALLGSMPTQLSSEVLAYEGQAPNDDIKITGALGQFVIMVAEQSIKADMVLDLSPTPIVTSSLLPPGYFHLDLEKDHPQAMKAQLVDMIGTFEKPRYFDYDASACAHGRSGQKGCTRCIDACPAGAITSLVDKIAVDPYLCQGGGICATVCPSSAISYAYPRPQDLLTHIRTLLMAYKGEDEGAPDLAFVTENEQARVEQALPAALIIVVEEVASVGPEAWLSALVWGARSVRLFDLDTMPEPALIALELHCNTAQSALAAMNYPSNAISIIGDMSELITCASMPEIKYALHAPMQKKRQSFFMALDHLVAQAEKVKPIVTLPAGAIFGEASVDKERCTLCMACVGNCPGNALQTGVDTPKLSFIEANCLQCGICTSTCPEDAITISPRLLLDASSRKKARQLNEDSPFCCTSCGKPYATKLGIATILTKLAGHSMFSSERALGRLKMCEDCRVRDMIDDPDVDF